MRSQVMRPRRCRRPARIYDPRDDGYDAPVGGPYVPYPPPPAARVYPGSYDGLPPQPAPIVEGFQRPPADIANGPGSDDVTGTVRAPTYAPPPAAAPNRNAAIAALPPDEQPETGPRKELPPQFRRQLVDYVSREPAGTIVIDTPNTYLYLVLGNNKAMRYGVGVGREGFTWTGAERISRMKEWPDWFPPKEMIEPSALPAALHGRRRHQSARRARHVSRQYGISHPRHQPAVDHRHLRVLGLHQADQRRRRRSVQPGHRRHARGGVAGLGAGFGLGAKRRSRASDRFDVRGASANRSIGVRRASAGFFFAFFALNFRRLS